MASSSDSPLSEEIQTEPAPAVMFTCITCRVAFVDADLQRAHYKTEWHRYNLKRKVAELPPVSDEAFQERVLAQQELETEQMDGKMGQHCQVCRKNFATEKSYASHLRSRKHKGAARALEKQTTKEVPSKEEHSATAKSDSEDPEKEEDEDVEGPVSEPLEPTECLFCPNVSSDIETNMEHMSKEHGFFTPDLEYLTDLGGLMGHLAEKVGIWNMCLYCNEKGKMFHSVEAVQHHMVDKGHCKLFFEGDTALEYAEFYDYSKSYPNYTEDGDFDKDEEVSPEDNALQVTDNLELVLPSGATVGHRSLKLYYKQNLPSNERRKATIVSRVMARYRAIGWKGSSHDTALRVKDKLWAANMKKHRDLKIGMRNNKNLQTYFRPQVVF